NPYRRDDIRTPWLLHRINGRGRSVWRAWNRRPVAALVRHGDRGDYVHPQRLGIRWHRRDWRRVLPQRELFVHGGVPCRSHGRAGWRTGGHARELPVGEWAPDVSRRDW